MTVAELVDLILVGIERDSEQEPNHFRVASLPLTGYLPSMEIARKLILQEAPAPKPRILAFRVLSWESPS